MLKTTGLSDKLASSRNNGSKSAFGRNNNSKPASEKNDSNGKVDEFGVDKNSVEHAKKSGKLSKLRKSKSEKMSKSRNLAKSGKKLSKIGNLTNSDAIEDRPKYLISDTRTALNCL